MDVSEEVEFIVAAEMGRSRADKALCAARPDMSRGRVQKLFAAGLVWRGDAALEKSAKVYAGDIIAFTIPPVRPAELRPAAIPLAIIFEDEHLVAVNKAAGMVTHPGAGTGEDTLVHALLHHCRGSLSGIAGIGRPGIVHRLDKETSGVIVAAKTDAAFISLREQFSERQAGKEYLAVVQGVPAVPSGKIEAAIGRHPVRRRKMAAMEKGRPALTHWERLKAFGDQYALVKAMPHTGRTHQIRVHLAHLGHPVAGDALYGFRPKSETEEQPPRLLLHARQLTLKHPATGQPVKFTAALPEDFQSFLSGLSET